MLCEQRPRVTGSVALHAAPGSRFAPFGFHDFMPHTQCDVQEQLDSVDKKLVAAMVVMIVAIMCLLIYFFPKPALGPHFSPCIENSQVQKNLGFHLRIFYQAKCIRCICSASSELFVPRRMPGLTSEVWAKVRSHLGTNRQNKSKWDWGSCLFDQIAWRLPWIGAVTFLLFRHNTISQRSNETHLCLCVYHNYRLIIGSSQKMRQVVIQISSWTPRFECQCTGTSFLFGMSPLVARTAIQLMEFDVICVSWVLRT